MREEAGPTAEDGDLASRTSHELRTPLSVIVGYAELLRVRGEDEFRRRASEALLAAAKRLESAVEPLVTVLAIDAGSLALEPRPVPLGAILDRAVELAEAAGLERTTVERRRSPAERAVVLADPEHLTRALASLLACASGRPGPAERVTISAELSADRAVLAIDPTPPGQPRSLAVHAARRLIELQGGTARATEASFVISVPLASGDDAVAPPRRVLVVDDDETVRGLLRLTLPGEAFTVLEAASGAEALALAEAEPPDLVLLDWRMPDCSGAEVPVGLRARWADLPLVVLTADTEPRPREVAAGLGADAFLTKPFSPLELLQTVERLAAAR